MNTRIPGFHSTFAAPAALVLLLSAGLKTQELYASPLTHSLTFESRTITQLLATTEAILCVWLLSGWRAANARTFAILVFAAFFAVSLSKWIAGTESCGCFGAFLVPPAVTTILDLIVLIFLALWQPLQSSPSPNNLLLWRNLAIALALATTLTPFTAPAYLNAEIGQVTADGSTIVMMPETWIDRPLPIADYISGDRGYMTGRWQLVLYHEDCAQCQRLLADLTSTPQQRFVVMVEVPPNRAAPRQCSQTLQWRKLSDEKDWFVSAPVILNLVDGVVVSVQEE